MGTPSDTVTKKKNFISNREALTEVVIPLSFPLSSLFTMGMTRICTFLELNYPILSKIPSHSGGGGGEQCEEGMGRVGKILENPSISK